MFNANRNRWALLRDDASDSEDDDNNNNSETPVSPKSGATKRKKLTKFGNSSTRNDLFFQPQTRSRTEVDRGGRQNKNTTPPEEVCNESKIGDWKEIKARKRSGSESGGEKVGSNDFISKLQIKKLLDEVKNADFMKKHLARRGPGKKFYISTSPGFERKHVLSANHLFEVSKSAVLNGIQSTVDTLGKHSDSMRREVGHQTAFVSTFVSPETHEMLQNLDNVTMTYRKYQDLAVVEFTTKEKFDAINIYRTVPNGSFKPEYFGQVCHGYLHIAAKFTDHGNLKLWHVSKVQLDNNDEILIDEEFERQAERFIG